MLIEASLPALMEQYEHLEFSAGPIGQCPWHATSAAICRRTSTCGLRDLKGALFSFSFSCPAGSPLPDDGVPLLIRQCCAVLCRDGGFETEGLFRLAGAHMPELHDAEQGVPSHSVPRSTRPGVTSARDSVMSI